MTATNSIWLEKIANALDRLAPADATVDWQNTKAATWRHDRGRGRFRPLQLLDDARLEDLMGIEPQKIELETNTLQFVKGYPANHALLWGAKGTGKSTLIHALLNRYSAAGLRLIEVDKTSLAALAEVAMQLAPLNYRFLLFCDDLSFEAEDGGYKALKSALEGSVFKGSQNVLIYATSNRRHLLPEYMSENQATRLVGTELHHSEAVEEKISLSDRFGLWLSFYPFSQDSYLAIAAHWVEEVAKRYQRQVAFDRDEALRWALARGGRSGRAAQQFARHWVGKALLEQGL